MGRAHGRARRVTPLTGRRCRCSRPLGDIEREHAALASRRVVVRCATRASANTPSSGRVRPMPNRPSTSQPNSLRSEAGGVSRDRHAGRAGGVERPAGVVGFDFDRHAHFDRRRPPSAVRAASTSASPPLLPGPGGNPHRQRADARASAGRIRAETGRPPRPHAPSACAGATRSQRALRACGVQLERDERERRAGAGRQRLEREIVRSGNRGHGGGGQWSGMPRRRLALACRPPGSQKRREPVDAAMPRAYRGNVGA